MEKLRISEIAKDNKVSMRLFSALERLSLKYVNIDEITSQRFLSTPNCGKRTFEELEVVLKKYKIQLK
jgi:hypothetical protein